MKGEFGIIAEIFAPLSAGAAGAFSLKDDAALLPESEFVVTKDLLVEGVHFRPEDPIGLVAGKALRVNLSDLAAKGAKPIGYFLGCVWPKGVKRNRIEAFADGLRADQERFKIALYGGDTAVHAEGAAPFTVSVTMFGLSPRSGIVKRSGARIGDDVYVSGTVGDAGLGLAILAGGLEASAAAKRDLVARYQVPTPPLALGGALADVASAAIDISDGLLADAGHLAAQSGVRIEISSEKIPSSKAAKSCSAQFSQRHAFLEKLATAGDDYEILFTAPPARRRSVEMAAKLTKTKVTRLGSAGRGEGVALLGDDGCEIEIKSSGYDHFRNGRSDRI